MRRLAILLMIFIYSRGAIGSEIDTIPWTASNIAKLNKLDKATVAASSVRLEVEQHQLVGGNYVNGSVEIGLKGA